MYWLDFINVKKEEYINMKFKKGDIAYIIENNSHVREVKVVGASGGFYTIKFCDSQSSAIRVREGRLYGSEEEANGVLGKSEKVTTEIHGVPLH